MPIETGHVRNQVLNRADPDQAKNEVQTPAPMIEFGAVSSIEKEKGPRTFTAVKRVGKG